MQHKRKILGLLLLPVGAVLIYAARADAADLAMRVMESAGAQKDSSWYQNAIEKGETQIVILPRKVEMVITD
jgi:hypothetical protein